MDEFLRQYFRIQRDTSERGHDKKAVLYYKKIKELDRYAVLEIRLKTGRHHQIRVQLANIGCIIKGDLK